MRYVLKIEHPSWDADQITEAARVFNGKLPGSFSHRVSPTRRVASLDLTGQSGMDAAINKLKLIEPQVRHYTKIGCIFSFWLFIDAPSRSASAVSDDYLFDCNDMGVLTSLGIALILSISSPADREN